MNPLVGWGLAVLSVALGYAVYGWGGVLLALSVVVFWLLLQFSRTLRVMRMAAGRPVGVVDNAVMLQAKLKTGLTLLQVLPLTRSLGRRLSEPGATPEVFAWEDGGGDRVQLELRDGRVCSVLLQRAPAGVDAETGADARADARAEVQL